MVAVDPVVTDAPDQALATEVRLYGELLLDLPKDLYIPPDALQLILEAFEGPLDLLLYLIRRQNFNILDIPMVALTQQYMRYVDELRSHNLELAAEYLLMAAMLIEIKSRMLLPKRTTEENEEEDPRAELVRRLLDYEKIKLAAVQIQQIPQAGRDFLLAQDNILSEDKVAKPLPQVSVLDLQRAWQAVLQRAKLVQHHQISREKLSVREFMSQVLRTLQGKAFIDLDTLFDPKQGVPGCIVTLIALLELTRERLIHMVQGAAYAPIYVRLAGQKQSSELGDAVS